MPRMRRSHWFGLLVAVLATSGAVLLRGAVAPLVGERPFNPILYLAVAFAIWFGGWAPGVLTAIAGYLAVHALYTSNAPWLEGAEWTGFFIYLGSCAVLIAFGEVMTSSERRLQAKQRELELESGERRVIEVELRASREREHERRLELEALMGSAPAAIWVAHDRECRTITGNPAAGAMLGVPAGANLSRTAPAAERVAAFEIHCQGRRLPPEELPMQTAAHTGAAVSNQELEFRFQDGRPSVWAYGNVEPLFDHRGEVRGAIGTFVDITERRRVEELQRESEARFRTLADQAPVLIWLNDRDGCEFVNREYLRFLGRPLDDVRGMGWAEFVHPDDMKEYVGAYQRAVEARDVFDAQFRFRRADGEYRWMKSDGLPRLTADGSLVGFVGCSVDITDFKQAMESLQESDRRKDEFLATLAHELRNPLAPLRNGVAILRLTVGASAEAAQTLGVMERQLSHLVRLIDDLIDVSRISRGKIELKRQRFDLVAAIAEVAAVAQPRVEEEERRLTLELPSEPLVVDGDITRLTQVVANLLDNAAKYTEGDGRILLALEPQSDHAVITVEDDGIGIPREMLDRVFEMFAQIEHPLESQRRGGLGIGLTLVKRLVELHGGTVEASSAGVGRGSRFVVRVPLAGEAAVAAATATGDPALVGGGIEARAASRRRVLVVDDNDDAASSQAEVLRLMGHDVRSAPEGRSALASAAAFRPELVLLDIGMPGIDGYEVCRRLRAQPWGADALIVAVTGWGQEADKQRAREAGFDLHLTKPMDPAALVALLDGVRPSARAASS